MRIARHVCTFALAGLMGVTMSVAAASQERQPDAAAAQVSGDELDAFAAAYQNVQALNVDYNAEIAEATDDTELQALLEEAQDRTTEIVEGTPGIDMDRYVEIIVLAEGDPDLSARIVRRLTE
ncbi:uncharacterized protein DUF4168 [Rhodovulum steppense]|uniref:Uncharacterized protein DUF4168 n=2 Tax=Rhodovulum steppense TaxID=540251 RepID=A0A4V2R4A3_9RHOB|nr:uncharacterized protein DUF4168 [Rhodovulum steppense]